jgi:hypothetical protein
MQTKTLSETIAEFKEENKYFFSDQNPFPDCANRWKEHSEKAVSIINKLEAKNETLQELNAISYDANARLKKENEALTQPKSDLPEVGSRWRDKKDHNYQLTVQEGICFTDNTSNLGYNLRVEDFLNDYEPIPTQSNNKE